MSRPIYENDETMADEAEVIDQVAARWKAGWTKLPRSYRADYALSREGKIVAWVEVKCRSNSREQYPTYMLSLGKEMALLDLARHTGCPAILVVRWTDQMGYVTLPVEGAHVMMGGRKDRGDSADIEPTIHIPTSAFKPMPYTKII